MKNKYVQWRPQGCGWCTEPIEKFQKQFNDDTVFDFFSDDIHEFKIVEMTGEEYRALPEFTGF